MRVAGLRSDGTEWVALDGGMAVLLRADRCSPPVDPAVIAQLGPWAFRPVVRGDSRELARRLDRARTVPLHTFVLGGPGSGNFGHAGRPGEIGGSSADGGSADGGGTALIPKRPLTPDERNELDTHLAGVREKIVGKNPTGQDKKDAATLAQPPSAYPTTQTSDKHSFMQHVTPGVSADDAITAMETGKRGVLTPERQALHDSIVRQFIKQSKEVKNPEVVVLGGGPASGKSSMPDKMENAITVDPDHIRLLIPDYASQAAGQDPSCSAVFTHEEASAIAKRIALEAGPTHNLVIDGTGDKSVESMEKKLATYRAQGQRVVGRYATNDVEAAISRAEERAQHPPYRAVPETTMRNTHAGVSRVLPELMEKDAFDEVELWDTNGPKGAPPVRVMSKVKGQPPVIHDQAKWDDFLAKSGKSKA